jgi:hypothetical protein
MSRFLCVAFGFLIACSCAPVYKTIVMQEYESKKIRDASLVIAPLGDVVVDYIGNVKDEFGAGDQQELILKHFREALVSSFKKEAGFSSVAFDNYATEPLLVQKKFDMGDAYDFFLNLPSDTNMIRFVSSTPDFVLFLQDVSIGIESFQEDRGWGGWGFNGSYPDDPAAFRSYSAFSGSSQGPLFQGPPPIYQPMPMMHSYYAPPRHKYLRYKCGFAFWDNRNHKLVVYGRIFAKSRAEGYGLDMVQIVRMENWNQVDYDFIRALVGNTPFDR